MDINNFYSRNFPLR